MPTTNELLSKILIPTASILFGVAVAYGVLKTQLSSTTAKAKENDRYIRQIDQRLSRIEGALGLSVQPFIIQPPRLGIQRESN